MWKSSQPSPLLAGWRRSREKADDGGDEVDEQEAEEVDQQLFEAGGGGGFGVVVAIDEVVDDAGQTNMRSMKGETSGRSIWKMRMLGSAKRPMALLRTKAARCFQTACRVPKDQRKRWRIRPLRVDGRFSEGQRAVFVVDFEALFEQVHGEVGVFGDGVERIAAGGFDGRGAPCADGSGNDGDDVEEVEGAALEVLAGDVFEGLPAGPEIDAVADLGVAGHGADARILEVGNELGDGVGGDHGVGVDADVDLFVHAVEGVVERGGLASVGLGENLHAAGGDLSGVGFCGHFGGAVERAVVDDDDVEVLVVGVEHRADGADDDRLFVVGGDEDGDARIVAGRGLRRGLRRRSMTAKMPTMIRRALMRMSPTKKTMTMKLPMMSSAGEGDGIGQGAHVLPEGEWGITSAVVLPISAETGTMV